MTQSLRVSTRRWVPKAILAWIALEVILFASACQAIRVDQDLEVATGLISHTLCSETFVSGLDPEQIYAQDIRPRPGIGLIGWAVSYDVDRNNRTVTTRVGGAFASRAIYRPGLGCLLVHGEEAKASEGLPVEQRYDTLLPEIAGPALVDTQDDGLRTALDHAFTEPTRPPYRWTKAIVIVHDGKVVAERYAPGYGIDTPLLGYSVTKSAINALLGILSRQDRLSIVNPAPVSQWRSAGDPRGAITTDELERMTSGLALDETESPASPVARMLYIETDMAGFAESAGLEAAPGSTWNYSSGNTIILSRIIRDAVGGTQDDVLKFAHRELFGPLGMRNVTLEFDATGTPVGSAYMLASARDWARLGVLYTNDGIVGGKRILPEGWVRYSSTQTLDSFYAAGFWVGSSQWRSRWGIPPDAFFASGLLGQRVMVIPSKKLVIARFGVTQDWPDFDIDGFGNLIADVLTAVARRTN